MRSASLSTHWDLPGVDSRLSANEVPASIPTYRDLLGVGSHPLASEAPVPTPTCWDIPGLGQQLSGDAIEAWLPWVLRT